MLQINANHVHFLKPNGASIEDLSKETLALEATTLNKKKTRMNEIFVGIINLDENAYESTLEE
jgi:hypothetical protein